MDNDPTKRRKLSDHALDLIMGDVLHGMQAFALEAQSNTTTSVAGTDDLSLNPDSRECVQHVKKR